LVRDDAGFRPAEHRTYINSVAGLHALFMMKRHYYPPLIPVVSAYAAGIFVQSRFDGALGVLGILTALSWALALIFVAKPRAGMGLILVVFFFVGALRWEDASRLPVRHIAHATPRSARWITLEGVVVASPRETKTFSSYVLRVEQARPKGGAVILCGDVSVRDHQKTLPVPGERLLVKGKLYKPPRRFAEFLARRRIYSMLSVSRQGAVSRKGRGVGVFSPLLVRRRLAAVIERHFEPVPASLLRAMMLGEKQYVPRPIKEAMIAAGTWHIMVVSGFHTAFVVGIVFLFLKIFRVPGRVRLVLCMAAVIGYCVLTGAAVSVVRATIMTVALLYTFLRERHPLFGHVIALAAFLILTWDPSALVSISFQLSFVSVVAIVSLMPWLDPLPWLNRMWRPSHPLFRLLRPPLTWAAVSLSAWIGTTPLIAAVFGIISIYGVAANIVAAPLAMGVIGSGSLAVFLGPFSENLAVPAAAACAFLIKLQVMWSVWIAGRPLAQVHLPLPGAGAFALYALMGLGLLLLSVGRVGRGRRDKKSCRR